LSATYPGLSANAFSGDALVVASMLHTGSPSYASGDMQVGAYCPLSTDPNLPGTVGAATPSTVKWTSQWLIYPSTSQPQPPATPNYSADPICSENLLSSGSTNQGSNIGDYASFVMTAVYDQPYTNQQGGTSYNIVAFTPSTAGQGICLAANNEASYIANETSLFHWLVGSDFPTAGTSFPFTDCVPRLWVISGGVN